MSPGLPGVAAAAATPTYRRPNSPTSHNLSTFRVIRRRGRALGRTEQRTRKGTSCGPLASELAGHSVAVGSRASASRQPPRSARRPRLREEDESGEARSIEPGGLIALRRRRDRPEQPVVLVVGTGGEEERVLGPVVRRPVAELQRPQPVDLHRLVLFSSRQLAGG